jgi:hypothetical protein
MGLLIIFGAVLPGASVAYLLWHIVNFFLRPYETDVGRVVAKSVKPEFVARGRYEYLLTLERQGQQAKVIVSEERCHRTTIGQEVTFIFQVGRLNGALDAQRVT